MSPNCEHCKDMEPWYSELALFFKEHKDRVPLAHINCENYIDFCRTFAIPSFPDVRLYLREHPITYHGTNHTMKGIKKWILKRLDIHPEHIKTVDQLTKLVTRKHLKKSARNVKIIFLKLSEGETWQICPFQWSIRVQRASRER